MSDRNVEVPLTRPTKHKAEVIKNMQEGMPEQAARRMVALTKRHKRALEQKQEARKEVALYKELALIDPLTGLANRRMLLGDESSHPPLEGELPRLLSLARRHNRDLSILFIDLDHFKVINDQYGHEQGNEVLREAAALLEETEREGDFTARLGGEEFVVVLPETSASDALTAAERVRTKFSKKSSESGGLTPTVSIGVASYRQGKDVSAEGLVHRADIAMYEAKSLGRDRVTAWEPAPSERREADEERNAYIMTPPEGYEEFKKVLKGMTSDDIRAHLHDLLWSDKNRGDNLVNILFYFHPDNPHGVEHLAALGITDEESAELHGLIKGVRSIPDDSSAHPKLVELRDQLLQKLLSTKRE